MDKPTSNQNLTINENILFWKNLFSSKITIIEIESILKLLKLDKNKNTEVINLSLGEIKKLELSRLIIEQKKLWVLDEPYIGLDISTVDLINQTIKNHTELGGMVIFASHVTPNIKTLHSLHLQNHE